jgi:hypothetical protein
MAYKRIRARSRKEAERKFKQMYPNLIFDRVGKMFSWYKHRWFTTYYLPTPPKEKPPEREKVVKDFVEEVIKTINKVGEYDLKTLEEKITDKEILNEVLKELSERGIEEKEGKLIISKPKEVLEKIGTDTESGFEIFYSKTNHNYVLIDNEGKEIRRSDYLEITETASIETDKGHQVPFACELTSITSVSKMRASEIDKAEKGIQKTLDNYFHSKPGFVQIASSVMKEGVEYRLTNKKTYPKARVIVEKTKPNQRRVFEEEIE